MFNNVILDEEDHLSVEHQVDYQRIQMARIFQKDQLHHKFESEEQTCFSHYKFYPQNYISIIYIYQSKQSIQDQKLHKFSFYCPRKTTYTEVQSLISSIFKVLISSGSSLESPQKPSLRYQKRGGKSRNSSVPSFTSFSQ
ncbi:unnamed protein product [Paramecium primaurelia]|uniref:Uncharacterized protein n=1 Tax=Paramecium primaurelia TaxID=5886 RepID=A0A8S1PC23_PARPR|nr:unnamed protein product [Paramecium primaurelia]